MEMVDNWREDVSLGADRPAILIVHGTADSAANWQSWCEWLGRLGWRAIAIDLPGHGAGASSSADSSVGACCDYLEPFVRKYQPTVLLGHSLGGVVAVELALHRVAVRKLLLVCPAIEMPVLTRAFYDWFVEYPLDWLNAQQAWLSPLLAVRPRWQTSLATPPITIRGAWTSLRTWQAPDWASLGIPTAIVGGQWDHIAPPSTLVRLARALPGSTLTILPGRHRPMDEAPTAFAHWLRHSLRL